MILPIFLGLALLLPIGRSSLAYHYPRTPTPTRPPRFIIPTKTPTPTLIKTLPTATRTQTTTTTPFKTSTPTVTPTKTPTPVQSNSPPTDSVKTYMMSAINSYRASQGLPAVQTDPYTCGFAKVRAHEISTNFNHAGFNNRATAKTLPYPSYSLITENIAMNSDYKNVVLAWINSSGHAKNIRANTPFVCVEHEGNYYAYEGWKP